MTDTALRKDVFQPIEHEATAHIVQAICDACDRAFGVMVETIRFAKCHICGHRARYAGPGLRGWNDTQQGGTDEQVA